MTQTEELTIRLSRASNMLDWISCFDYFFGTRRFHRILYAVRSDIDRCSTLVQNFCVPTNQIEDLVELEAKYLRLGGNGYAYAR